ncbi:AAA-ATPase At3g28580-like [Impatiens glandulifera]|uniref:AAA-ATPase At3g28580-like n=1 Tax=Impatiens glandulifera TaxID=253017 RepID=UPI001FB0DE11|nr:AAA-ATPase At3g28580-like [Impatiens glandulifera]
MGSQQGANNLGMAMAIAVFMVILTTFQQFLSSRFRPYAEGFIRRFISSVDPYVQIKFHEDSSDGSLKNSEAFNAIETYLSCCCLSTSSSSRFKAKSVRDIREPILCPDEGERVTDYYQGIELWWEFKERTEDYDRFRGSGRKIKCYTLTFRKTWREKVVNEYVKHVMEEGTAAAANQRQLKLYTNSGHDHGEFGKWKCMKNFDHPATFATLGMEESKKQDIIDDLKWFSNGRDYFRSIGKPWKRGYLLYGPPGTGKSTMIAAMANLLGYNVYDLELTTIRNNASFKGY